MGIQHVIMKEIQIALEAFLIEHEICCKEDILETPSAIECFPVLLEEICETIGYYDQDTMQIVRPEEYQR